MLPQQRSESAAGGDLLQPGGTAPQDGSWHTTPPSKQKHILQAPMPDSSSPCL
jgi:hypothetical protein